MLKVLTIKLSSVAMGQWVNVMSNGDTVVCQGLGYDKQAGRVEVEEK